MARQKLLIADANEEYPRLLTQLFRDRYEIRCSKNGREVLALLESFQPDLLVLELMLEELDGLTMLRQAKAARLMPNVLVISRMVNDYTFPILCDLGISYAIRTPCELDASAAIIQDLMRLPADRTSLTDLKPRIQTLLHTLCFSPKHDGYHYLQLAIEEMAHRPGQSITKELYPAVAAAFGCSGAQVERSIRTAIAAAWSNSDGLLWAQAFSLDPDQPVKRPTNSEFIIRSLEAIGRL